MTNATPATHFRTCPLCEACCGLEITTKGDQVVRIRGDINDPYSKGFICPKGSALKSLHEDPDRLKTPRIRTADGWKDVTWDEAFAEIERRLSVIVAEHGRQALGTVLGNPTTHNLGGMIHGRTILDAVGSTNIFSASTVDQMPKHVSAGLMWGRTELFPLPDIDRTDYLLLLGANPWVSNGSLVSAPDMPGRLEALAKRGAFVVVDPRRTKTAENASEHLSIVPGTDALWLMALVHTLYEEDLVAIGRLESHVSGVDEVRAMVSAYSPEAVAGHCGIEAATTRRIARELAAAPAAAVYGRMGTHAVEFGTVASWAADVLNVLTGNLDRPGGVMFNCAPTQKMKPSQPGGRGFKTGRWKGRASGRPEVRGELPAATLAEEITTPGEGAIRGLFVLGCNPVRSFPNSRRIDEAFEQLDLLVVVDPYVTATARHAHVILPPTSALERSHYDFIYEGNMLRSFAKYSPAVFASEGLNEEQILCRLALVLKGEALDIDPVVVHDAMMGKVIDSELRSESSPIYGQDRADILAALSQWEWAEQLIDFRLRVGQYGDGFGARPDGLTLRKLIDEHPSGADFGPLVPRFPGEIATESGTVELAPQLVVDDMARLAQFVVALSSGREDQNLEDQVLKDKNAGTRKRQFLLIGRRHLKTVNSWTHNVRVLMKGRTECTLLMHPDDAERLGVPNGGSVTIASRVGEIAAPVEISDEVMPGVVCLPHGWGYDTDGIEMHTARIKPGVNSNDLTDDQVLDVLSGNCSLNGIPVRVSAEVSI